MLDQQVNYEDAWLALNRDLRLVEAAEGLGGAVAALEENQKNTGFIRDSLFGVERHVFHCPGRPELYFRVQFNAKRSQRFNGNGKVAPPAGVEVVNAGCFLCRDNVRWQQGGAELGFEVAVDDRVYLAWMNPFPLMPGHVVFASARHETQDWAYGPGGGADVSRLVGDLVRLAARMPGFVGFHNGVDAGASIPTHLHFQFFNRPADMPEFPLEAHLAAFGDGAPDGTARVFPDYPVPVVRWTGTADAVAADAARWIDGWARRNVSRLYRMTSNIVATAGADGGMTLYFVPRDRTKARGEGMSGLVGGLEALGEIVLSSPEERQRIDAGAYAYAVIENILASVRTPLFVD